MIVIRAIPQIVRPHALWTLYVAREVGLVEPGLPGPIQADGDVTNRLDPNR